MFFMRTKSTKSTKRKQAAFAQMFFIRTEGAKSIKSTKRKQVTFFFLEVFIAHKNIVFYTQKSAKTHIGKQATFFLLDVF